MPDANPAALEFLLTRRSRPARTLRAPVPDRAALLTILTAAARVPDHGKLEPWRFIVLAKPALSRLGARVADLCQAAGLDPDRSARNVAQFAEADLAVAVVLSPKPSDKAPLIEQTYSAGAVCLSLLNAALAAGWGANWLTGWASENRAFVEGELGLLPTESIAGFIHIGTESSAPPDRPRPDLGAITTWMAE